MQGRLSPFIELGVGFNPDLAARDNVVINAVMMGLSRAEARRRFDEIIAFAELEEFVDLKLKNYSLGHGGAARLRRLDPGRRRGAAGRRGARRRRRLLPAEVLRRLPPPEGRGQDDPAGDPRHGPGRAVRRPRDADRARRGAEDRRPARDRRACTTRSTSASWSTTSPPRSASPASARPRSRPAGSRSTASASTDLPQGELLEIVHRGRFDEAVEDPVFGLSLRNDAGHTVFATSTQWDTPETGRFEAGETRDRARQGAGLVRAQPLPRHALARAPGRRRRRRSTPRGPGLVHPAFHARAPAA